MTISTSAATFAPCLQRHGWALAKAGDNEYWRRPGKTSGWSATLKDGVFYVFSSSAAPFEQNRAYSPFSVYAMLEHGGDFAAAASALRGQGFGDDPLAGRGRRSLEDSWVRCPTPRSRPARKQARRSRIRSPSGSCACPASSAR